MDSHDGKRRSHQRFLRNLPKQKKYLKVIISSVVEVILSSVADPDNLEGGRGGFGGFVACSASFSSFCDSFSFLTQYKEGLITHLNYSPLKNQNPSISFFINKRLGRENEKEISQRSSKSFTK